MSTAASETPWRRKKIGFSIQNPVKSNRFLSVAGPDPARRRKKNAFQLKFQAKMNHFPSVAGSETARRRFSPYRRGIRCLMLVRYLRGQRQSHHTVENCDVRNSFLPEVSKVHAIWHLSVYFLGRLLITILVVSATPQKTSVPSRA